MVGKLRIESEMGGRWSIFFFQAEDGIRDDLVTGVQTCALPIWAGKEKMWQHLCEIAARPLVPTLKAHDLKSEESASISNQAPYEPG